MKTFLTTSRIRFLVLLAGSMVVPAARADQVKANNDNNLETGSSWVNNIAPAGTDNAIWNSTVATPANCTNTLGSAVVWGGIVISNPSAPVVINGTSTSLTLSNGINLSSASVNLLVNCGTLDLAASQTWTVPTGRALTTGNSTSAGSVSSLGGDNYTVTLTGGGLWTTSGTGDNGSLGVKVAGGTFNLNKTSSSGAHAVGGPGLTIQSGGTARITGTGGDQIYNGGSVLLAAGALLDLNGNSETIYDLSGAGGVVDNTAAGTGATLTLANGNATFSGTLQNSGAGATLALVENGTGTSTLNGVGAFTGGTTVTAGTLVLNTVTNASMPYVVNGGTLEVSPSGTGSSLPMTTLTLGGGASQLTFNLGGQRNLNAPLVSDGGKLTISASIPVNVANVIQSGTYVLLQYAGTRSGTGGFVAGSLPAGASITDNVAGKQLVLNYVSPFVPRLILPDLNTNEVVVAVATPQQYGAVGDGITDDSSAFQNAMNAVYNSGGSGGGVVYVPAANYAFYNNLTIPTGVTLHGDWQDWTRNTNGLVGTTFKVYLGAGQSNGTPFITMSGSCTLKGINLWYPNQNPNSIVSYPFSISASSDCVVENVALVNSYQGIMGSQSHRHIFSNVVGTPLYSGIDVHDIYDIPLMQGIRFSPAVWPASGLTNAPSASGTYTTWMRNYGTGMTMVRDDGEISMDTYISGYNVGILFTNTGNGDPGCTFYSGAITNCAIGILAQDMPNGLGLMFANFTFDDDVALERTRTDTDANMQFEHCTFIGRNGPAVSSTGADSSSWMQFQDCTISNALELVGPGVLNVVNSTLLGATQSVLSASATRVAFTGCTFSPAQKIVNNGNVSNLLVNARSSITNALPLVYWTNVINDYLSRHAARTNLYVVTDVAWGAYGNGVNDDTAALQAALTAAGTNGGGLVYVPAGLYKLTSTLTVPDGVELRGAYEMRHWPGAAADGYAKGSVLRPYGGQGTTNGPVAIALAANSGLVGVTISYENQNNSCIPFPPAIQGQGGNVYAIGVACPNPYYYVDLDTYTCTNHFLYMVDGWTILNGFDVGHGSSGSIVDCMGNWTYWISNGQSQSTLPPSVQGPVLEFVLHQSAMYELGNCTELLMKNFNIIENTYLAARTENGLGPNATMIGDYCDATIRGIVLDAPAAIAAVNTPLCVFNVNNDSDLSTSTVDLLSTTNFLGTAEFLNTSMFAEPWWDANINGGEVILESAHMNDSQNGSIVNGGVFHLVNLSATTAGNIPYQLALGFNAGIAGKTNEFIGCFAENGCSYVNEATNHYPQDVWNDYALANYSILNPNLPVITGQYPNNSALFEYTNALVFVIAAPEGVATSNIVLVLNGLTVTNLSFSGSSYSWTVSYPLLALNAFYTATIKATDNAGQSVSTTTSFDTFSPYNYTFEAEDFDYTGSGGSGLFIDNPHTDAYAGLGSTAGIDCFNNELGEGSTSYRPQGLETENASDLPRPAYAGGLQDYDVGFASTGNWGNYTRSYPAGAYYVYLRAADGIAAAGDSASMYLVTSGQSTTNQITRKLGTFAVPATGNWQVYTWVPLKTANGSLVVITNSGSPETLRVTTDNGSYNANFYQLVPASSGVAVFGLTAVVGGQNLTLSFQTLAGYNYQVEYKNNLTDPDWLPLGAAVAGDGAVHLISDPLSLLHRFYQVQIW